MTHVEPPASLSRRFELASSQVAVGARTYDMLRPRSVDDLISEEDFAIDERIPYWADCWPSGRILAERLAREPGRRRSLLELGCGIGLVSVAAAAAGFRVLATDYYADALEFTAANAERNGVGEIDTRLVDWRSLPDDLGAFDLVVAADVLYELPQAVLIAAALERALAPGGYGLVTDPGRRTSLALVQQCAARGLRAQCIGCVPTTDAGAKLTVSVYEIRRAGSGAAILGA
ncbi:MAG: methyltransferase domain-containing protein [Pirellulales bacterium]